jgi:antitoxin HicB
MKKKSPHVGSTFESWLDERGLREEVTVAAIKSVRKRLADGTKKRKRMRSRRDGPRVTPAKILS